MNRRPRIVRLLPVFVALAIFWWVDDAKGRHPVELMFALPNGLLVPRVGAAPSFSVRILKPDGALVIALAANGIPDSHSVIIPTKLPKGRYHAEALLSGHPHRLAADIDFHGEDAVEVDLAE